MSSERALTGVDYPTLWETLVTDRASGKRTLVTPSLVRGQHYRPHTSGRRDVVEITLGELTYLFAATPAPAVHEADNRVIGLWGRSALPRGEQDRVRMKGHPSPQRANPQPVDRGHLAAHASGGGYDLNLIPQLATLNRGRRWRELERHCAANPGTFFFVHALYENDSDHPSELEFGVVVASGSLRGERFLNR